MEGVCTSDLQETSRSEGQQGEVEIVIMLPQVAQAAVLCLPRECGPVFHVFIIDFIFER